MKTNYWLVLAATLSTSLMVQVAAEAATKVAPGPARVTASNVNVRGQATLRSEVITQLTKGDTVTVLDEITLADPKANEPAKWARIAFPGNGHVWLHASFIDARNKTVLPNKLNLRAGPGENFSVIGLLQKGEAVKEITTKGNWTEIQAPPSAYAFIAAQYLKQEAPAAPAKPAPAMLTMAKAAPPQAAPAPARPASAPAPAALPAAVVPSPFQPPVSANTAAQTKAMAERHAQAGVEQEQKEVSARTATVFAQAQSKPDKAEARTAAPTPAAAAPAPGAPVFQPVPPPSPDLHLPLDASRVQVPPDKPLKASDKVKTREERLTKAEAEAVRKAEQKRQAAEQAVAKPEPKAKTADLRSPKMAGQEPGKTALKPADAEPVKTEVEPAKTKAEPAKTKPALEKKAISTKATAFPPMETPALPISGDKEARLAELLKKYKADEIAPDAYHEQRAKILAEP